MCDKKDVYISSVKKQNAFNQHFLQRFFSYLQFFALTLLHTIATSIHRGLMHRDHLEPIAHPQPLSIFSQLAYFSHSHHFNWLFFALLHTIATSIKHRSEIKTYIKHRSLIAKEDTKDLSYSALPNNSTGTFTFYSAKIPSSILK